MATYVTSVGGKTVELCRLGSQGSGYQLQEYNLITSESGLNTIDTFSIDETTTSVYIIQLASSSGYQYSKVTVMHNGTIVQVLESTTLLNEIRLGTFSADIVEDNVELYCDVLTPITHITFIKSELSR